MKKNYIKKRKIKNSNSNVALVLATLTIVIFLLTYANAAFSDQLTISGSVAHVRIDANIRVVNATATSNGGTVNTVDYTARTINSSVTMPNNSTVTYTVTVTNFGNVPMAIYAIDDSNLPSGVTILSVSGYNVGDKVCDNSNSSKCTLNATKTFTITVGYSNFSGTTNQSIALGFDFVQVYDVTYNHMTNNSYPAVAYKGKPFQVTFTGDIPADVVISPNHNHTYQNNTLTIPSVTNNITIDRYYSITYNLNSGTQANNQVTRYLYGDNLTILNPTRNNYTFQGWYENAQFTGNAITSTNGLNRNLTLYAKWAANYSVSYVDITDSNNYTNTAVGGTTFTLTFTTPPTGVTVTMGGNTLTEGTNFTYSNGTITIPNVSGNIVITGSSGNSQIIHNPDGSTTEITTNNDGSTTTTNTDTSGNASAQTVDQNNKVIAYTIDTTGNNNGGLETNDTVETGFIPFDGSSNWELTMTYQYDRTKNNSSTTVAIVSCADFSSGSFSNGFVFRHTRQSSGSAFTINSTVEKNSSATVDNWFTSFNTRYITAPNPSIWTIHVVKSGNNITGTVKPEQATTYQINNKGATTTDSHEDTKTWTSTFSGTSTIDVTIGGRRQSDGTLTQKAVIEVLSFDIHKTN